MNTTIAEKILQAEAAVRVATRKVNGKIWKQEKLITAQDILNGLKMHVVGATPPRPSPAGREEIQPPTPVVVNAMRAAELLADAKKVKKKLCEFSNLLHCTDGDEKVALLEQIAVLNVHKEDLWTNYFHFKRNGTEREQAEEKTPFAEYSEEILRLEKMNASEMQKRSRAKKRLDTEPLSDKQRRAQEEKWARHNMEVLALTEKIKELKHG